MTVSDDPIELDRVSEQIYDDSQNSMMNRIVHEEEDITPDFSRKKVFLGWDLGGKKEFREMQQRFENLGFDRNEAIQKASRKFAEKFPLKKEPVFVERGERGNADALFMAGQRGSGKSVLLRGLTDRGSKSGELNIIVDTESEFHTKLDERGIQQDIAGEDYGKLREGEEPGPIDAEILMPRFVRDERQKNGMPENQGSNTTFFKFGFQDLEVNDLVFLFKEKLGDKSDIDAFTSELDKRMQEGEVFRTWSDVKDLVEEMQGKDLFSYNQRADQIKGFIDSTYKQHDFLGAGDKIDIASVAENTDTVILSLNEGETLPRDLHMKELYVSILIKRVRDAIERGDINRVVNIVVDECHRFVPADEDKSEFPSKEQFIRVVKRDRKRGLRVTAATQEVGDVQEENFLNQTNHFLVPYNMSAKPRRHVLKKAGVWTPGDQQRAKWTEIFRCMGKYQWMYCESEGNDWMVVEPAVPLTRHYTG